MSEFHVRRIQKRLEHHYEALVDVQDMVSRPEQQRKSVFLTRAQAALALTRLTSIDREIAAASVVDGFEDNGIDAIFYDKSDLTLYCVQSKWVTKGVKCPESSDISKFVEGVRDLLSGQMDRFNSKIRAMEDDIMNALENPAVTLVLVVAYTGTQAMDRHVERPLADYMDELNDPTVLASYEILSQKEIYDTILGGRDGTAVDLDVTLYDWGQIREPYHAVYGQVRAEDVALWYKEHGSKLLEKNLRHFKGDTNVNRAIQHTLVSEAEKFWYFNNGVTALCDKVAKLPKGGSDRGIGNFHLEGVSVVNGAQTVAVISNTVSQGFPKATDARLLVRFISLEGCPETLANEITTATNTQNKIEARDFASLDPTQKRIQEEMQLDLDKTYSYKSGERTPSKQDGCTIEEATVALACAYHDVRLCAVAKRHISGIWENVGRQPYTLIYNDELTSFRVWRTVAIMRKVDDLLDREIKARNGLWRRVIVHGRRFILHRLFGKLDQSRFNDVSMDMSVALNQIEAELIGEVEQIVAAVHEHYPEAYLNSFFNSGKRCQELSKLLPSHDGADEGSSLRVHPQKPLFDLDHV